MALAGGVGAARFLKGLVRVVTPRDVTVVVNTGDDEVFYGLLVCPDLDTITYNLAGAADEAKGWGIGGDTFHTLDGLRRYGYDTWFALGDGDLATHLHRNLLLQQGMTLSQATDAIARAWQVEARLLPMTDHRVATRFVTDHGTLAFQDYFVKRQASPSIKEIVFEGAEKAAPAPGILEAVASARGIIVCPSNPLISIGPILAVPGIREALRESHAPVVGISPIIAGEAVKGPLKKMMEDMSLEATAYGVAQLYRDFLDCFIIDHRDASLQSKIRGLGMEVVVCETLMSTPERATDLAGAAMKALGLKLS